MGLKSHRNRKRERMVNVFRSSISHSPQVKEGRPVMIVLESVMVTRGHVTEVTDRWECLWVRQAGDPTRVPPTLLHGRILC